jgi:hypothetical protein
VGDGSRTGTRLSCNRLADSSVYELMTIAIRPPHALAIATAALLLVPSIWQRIASTPVTTKRVLTADDILAMSLEARGGCTRPLREVTLTGRIVDIDGTVSSISLWNRAPRELRMVVTWPGELDYRLDVVDDVVTLDQGIIGGIRDRQVLTESEREQTLIDATFECDPSEKHWFRSSKLLGITDFEGSPAYQIERTTLSGLTRTSYIAVDSLLPIGDERETVADRPAWDPPGPPYHAKLRWVSSDFRRVNGVLIPFQSRQSTLSGDDFLHTNTFYVEQVSMKYD